MIMYFLVMYFIYEQQITLALTILKVISTCITFFTNSLFLALFQYINKMHLRMESQHIENTKMLDGMHEGLLIISKMNNDLMFCNNSAQKLLGAAIENYEIFATS